MANTSFCLYKLRPILSTQAKVLRHFVGAMCLPRFGQGQALPLRKSLKRSAAEFLLTYLTVILLPCAIIILNSALGLASNPGYCHRAVAIIPVAR